MDIYLSLSPFGEQRLSEGVRLARELGCSGVEVPAGLLDNADSLAALEGMPARVVATSWRSDSRPDLRAALAQATRVGAWALNVYVASLPGEDPVVARQALVEDIRSAIAGSEGEPVCVLLENALEPVPGVAASGQAWEAVLEAVDSPRFRGTFDPANFVASGDAGAVQGILQRSVALIAHVHAKGVLPYDAALHEREPFRRKWQAAGAWLAAPAGEGEPDWTPTMRRLLEAGYRGAVTLEPFAVAEPIRRSVEALRRIVASLAAM